MKIKKMIYEHVPEEKCLQLIITGNDEFGMLH